MNPKPFATGLLPIKDGHQVYYEQYGNAQGPAIVVLHGGPGSKSKPRHITPFDTDKYHVITFHQRGCGSSLPLGEIKNNTTSKLASDIDRLRTHLQIKNWFVAGSSWGSTLALAYAETYPDDILGLLLSSIFLGRKKDLTWQLDPAGGLDRIFPDLWEYKNKFLAQYKTNPKNAPAILLKLLQTGNENDIHTITAGVLNWEGNLMNAQADLIFTNPEDVTDEMTSSVTIGLHYELNNFFLKPNQLLQEIKHIIQIPTIIVHGRYDLLCPAGQAWDLHLSLPHSEIVILPTSNHRLTAEGEIAKKFAFKSFLGRHTK